ncbi:tbc1 domain family member whacked [Anaeramoeba ignava]|uniref:Tbc1 domain family member whacked n=1 Tax=Anaeramoeba ignava TaxID=1746090 RepID=A0A9Q0LRK4_ANAIG|nr:tbc1 domain family member whacked [Anaeramoeba ignava]
MSKDNSKKETKEEETQEKLFQYDRYGFLLEKELPQDRTKDELKSVKNEVNNADKWNEMMNNWEKFATKKKNILKKRIRKGIPGPFRGKAWFKITESDSLREKMKKKGGEDFYQKLLEKQNEKANMVIERDIDRTFPKHEHYREGSEQKRLSRVLRAWSVYNETVGYCQGMAFSALHSFFLWKKKMHFGHL